MTIYTEEHPAIIALHRWARGQGEGIVPDEEMQHIDPLVTDETAQLCEERNLCDNDKRHVYAMEAFLRTHEPPVRPESPAAAE